MDAVTTDINNEKLYPLMNEGTLFQMQLGIYIGVRTQIQSADQLDHGDQLDLGG